LAPRFSTLASSVKRMRISEIDVDGMSNRS
jgi:hypothetical protein